MSKNKKVNKIVNNFIDDCNSFHNKCNVESKANRFSTISNNIKKLLNSKFNKPNSENVIPNYNLVSNRVINSLISDINYNVINENLRNSDLPGLISSDISRNMSYFDTIVTYISVITQTDADSIFVYLSNRFDILNTQVTTFLNYTIYNEYFINTLKDIIDDENYTDQIIIEELESSIIRYINDMNNHDFIINDPEPSTLPI